MRLPDGSIQEANDRRYQGPSRRGADQAPSTAVKPSNFGEPRYIALLSPALRCAARKFSDFVQAEDIIAALGLPNVKLQFDIYHRQILHGDVTAALRRLLPMIGHIQTASVPDRNEPGTGELDDFRIFRLLDEIGYRGHVGCEYRPASSTREGLGWLGKTTDMGGA